MAEAARDYLAIIKVCDVCSGWFIWNAYLLYSLPSIHMDDPVYQKRDYLAIIKVCADSCEAR